MSKYLLKVKKRIEENSKNDYALVINDESKILLLYRENKNEE